MGQIGYQPRQNGLPNRMRQKLHEPPVGGLGMLPTFTRAPDEGRQSGGGHKSAEPILLAPRNTVNDWWSSSRFLAGLRLCFGYELLDDLRLLLCCKLLLDACGNGIHIHFVDLRRIAENPRGIGLVVRGQ